MPFLAPVFAGITAFASTALGSIVINAAIGIGASLLSGILFPPTKPEAPKPSGMRLTVAMGETIPLSFPVGYCATAGSRKYAMSWGNSGEVPNAYRTEVVQISDMLLPGLAEFWAFKQKCTILWGDTPTAQGYPVQEFRVAGVDYMWVKFRTGAEVAADAFMVSTFGTHPEYPWTSAFIGREAPHAIVTMLFNRELFKNDPAFLFVPTPMKFYDLRKDSTNGGSGSHRWDDQSTWESTVNPVVVVYNIVRGIYRPDGTWIYGGRNLPAQRLPASSWMAAANECDALRTLDGGGTEPQFRCGIEINVNVEPLTMIEELLRACSGRMAEIGGIFEILVGSPGAAVYSFTDANIMISRGQKYSSFPGLASTHNAIEATYVEPSEMWVQRAAPARFSATYEAQDGGRRLATGVSLLAVPYGVQAQQIMRTLLEDDRKWRTHWITLPPDAWILTGTCVVNWTSVRNGYINKKFLVISASGEPGMCQSVVLREIDPNDYAWSSDDELPNPVGQLVIVRPSAQLVTGFQALPATIYDTGGNARRPSIRITYDGNMPDIQFVHVLVRLKSSGAYVFDGFIPFEVPYSNILNGVFLPDTLYEAAAKYIPFTGRPTEFTEYQDVLTPNVKLGPLDVIYGDIDLDELGEQIEGYFDWMGGNIREIIEKAQEQDLAGADQEFANAIQFDEVRRNLSTVSGNLSASFQETITVAIVPMQGQLVAIADALTELSAADDGAVNTARIRFTVMTGPSGYSRVGIETRFDPLDGGDYRLAGSYWDTPNNPLLPTRRVEIAEQFVIAESVAAATYQPFIFEAGAIRVANAFVGRASIQDAAINAAKIEDATITGAKIANATIGSAQIQDAAITSAKIGNATIQTANIISGNVTASAAFLNDGAIAGSIAGSNTEVTVATLAVNAPVGTVIVMAKCQVTQGDQVQYDVSLKRDGVVLGSRRFSTAGVYSVDKEISFVWLDSAPGNVTYTLVHRGHLTPSSVADQISFRSIITLNNKV